MEALEHGKDRDRCSLVGDGAPQHLVHHVLFIHFVILRVTDIPSQQRFRGKGSPRGRSTTANYVTGQMTSPLPAASSLLKTLPPPCWWAQAAGLLLRYIYIYIPRLLFLRQGLAKIPANLQSCFSLPECCQCRCVPPRASNPLQALWLPLCQEQTLQRGC